MTRITAKATHFVESMRNSVGTGRELAAELVADARADARWLSPEYLAAEEAEAAAFAASVASSAPGSLVGAVAVEATASHSPGDVPRGRSGSGGVGGRSSRSESNAGASVGLIGSTADDADSPAWAEPLHPALSMPPARIAHTSAALLRIQRVHDRAGQTALAVAESIIVDMVLRPAQRLQAALAVLRRLMDKRRRYLTDVDAFSRQVCAYDRLGLCGCA